MALQTEVHSTAPSPSTSPNVNGSSDSNPINGFSLSASPPLILAFLAVGVFGITMAIFFCWRRVNERRRARNWVRPADAAPLETPTLWDIWCPRERAGEEAGGAPAEWRTIQPLSVTVWDNRPMLQSPPPPPIPANDISRYDGLLAQAFAHLRQRHRRFRRRSEEEDTTLELKPSQSAQPPATVQLQVAVTIAMPNPNFAGVSSNIRTDPDDGSFEYSIAYYCLYSYICAKIGDTYRKPLA
ncbi:hypothetical protein GGX14DRAFT_623674 [Mycena pura]|uniref:Uncharacterized protein n=1 Tax=Mycena pura TaxID=153505 RepID=A0AAD6VF15_9AGAR|nr:hypothetical protein GGX14DRAFT_623674 [Mycena pura]